ncbi:Predicted manganese transporter, 11 TMS [Pseudoalteromonas luteoviolacea B = ATCC 29581]|nr:Predicted manganese transporter, 11 TMS [Pseudoalteromonas luteoviolacea B = ATCC 29581]
MAFFAPTGDFIRQALADAFYQVSAFVAVTLFGYYHLSRRLPSLELAYLHQKNPYLEVLMASLLGALPGCGGAIIVVTQFTKKQASFASVMAVLVSTMGDAAFVLLAQKPVSGLIIISLGIITGFLCGMIALKLCRSDAFSPQKCKSSSSTLEPVSNHISRFGGRFWQWLMLPCAIIALINAFSVNLGYFQSTVELLGVIFSLLVVLIWCFSPKFANINVLSEHEQSSITRFEALSNETNFISVWVISSFVLFELTQYYFGFNLGQWFTAHMIWAPLLATVVGVIPGCGPQIILTMLYLQGLLPISALAANAISNDGDALFPALALAPKAAIVATLFSAIPALVVGYSLFYFGL